MTNQIKSEHPSQKETNDYWRWFKTQLLTYGFDLHWPKSEIDAKFALIGEKVFEIDDISISLEIKHYSDYDPYYEYKYIFQHKIFEELKIEEMGNDIVNKFSYDLLVAKIENITKRFNSSYSEQERINYLILKSKGYKTRTIRYGKRQRVEHYSKSVMDLNLSFELRQPDENDEYDQDRKTCNFKAQYYSPEEDFDFYYDVKFKFSDFNEKFVNNIEQFVFQLYGVLIMGPVKIAQNIKETE